MISRCSPQKLNQVPGQGQHSTEVSRLMVNDDDVQLCVGKSINQRKDKTERKIVPEM